MKKVIILVTLLFCATSAQAQLSAYTGWAVSPQSSSGITPSFVVLAPIQYGQVRVCTVPSSNSPCTPLATIYDFNSNTLTVSGGNFGQVLTDVTGKFSFQCSAGTYLLQVAASGSNTPQLTYEFSCPSLSAVNLLPLNNTFTGLNIFANLDGIRWEDAYAGASPAARTSAAVLSCGSNPCTVGVPSYEANTELLGNLTTSPGANQLIWTMNNAGYGGSQGTNWLLCDFSGTAAASPCVNPGGPQVFQIGRTFNNSPANGNQVMTIWGKWTGVSANTLGFPPDALGLVSEMSGFTQSNGTPAPVIGLDNVISVRGTGTTVTNVRFFSTDPGGLNNATGSNTITNMYGYFAQGCASCVPAGLAVTNWYNGWFEDPVATRVTNSYALWSNGRTVVNDSGNLTPVLLSINYNNTRAANAFQVFDASISRVAIEVAQNGRFDIFQHANGVDGMLMARFTDSSPTGNFIHMLNAAQNADIFDLAVNGAVTTINAFTGNTVALTADWTCGTGGTVSSCVAATIIGSGGGVPLTFTLPLTAQSYTLECDGVVGQATAATANQWNLLTATNGATNVTANYSMATAVTASAFGAVTDQASTTTTFQIAPSWTLGGTGTKMPFHIWAKIEGASASGTVVSLQLLAPTVGDLVTIYRGTACRVF